MFHGSTIERVNIINHRFSDKSRDFYRGLLGTDESIKLREGWQSVKFGMISPSYNEYDRISRDQIRNADIIFCTTPSTEVLFDHTILTNPSGRVKGRLIIGVGSFKSHMIEIPHELLLQAVKLHGAGLHFRKRAIEGGVVLVDTINALNETGELTRAQADGTLNANNVIEIGEIVLVEESYQHDDGDSSAIDDSSEFFESMSLSSPTEGKLSSSSLALAFREQSFESGSSSKAASRKSSFSKSLSRKSSLSNISRKGSRVFRGRYESSASEAPLKKKMSKEEEELSRWLHKGNVIYKSVGLGLMDLVVGMEVVSLAKEKRVGVTFDDF
jgi:ornithine cyclodeaminase/alanine dehydrogenase-like protein (mu-crystallin family)